MPRKLARRLVASALTTLVLVAANTLARAQAPRSAAPPLDKAARAEIIDGVIDQLGQHYVEADTAKMIAAILKSRLKAGAYDTVASVYGFAEVVTADLRRVNGDLHLSLRYDPE